MGKSCQLECHDLTEMTGPVPFLVPLISLTVPVPSSSTVGLNARVEFYQEVLTLAQMRDCDGEQRFPDCLRQRAGRRAGDVGGHRGGELLPGRLVTSRDSIEIREALPTHRQELLLEKRRVSTTLVAEIEQREEQLRGQGEEEEMGSMIEMEQDERGDLWWDLQGEHRNEDEIQRLPFFYETEGEREREGMEERVAAPAEMAEQLQLDGLDELDNSAHVEAAVTAAVEVEAEDPLYMGLQEQLSIPFSPPSGPPSWESSPPPLLQLVRSGLSRDVECAADTPSDNTKITPENAKTGEIMQGVAEKNARPPAGFHLAGNLRGEPAIDLSKLAPFLPLWPGCSWDAPVVRLAKNET